MGMDLRTLEYYTVVARELNISRAAEKLAMSQPPLSSQMKNLEEDLGVTLFIRGKRHLTLTEAGIHLLHRAEQMLELADKTRNELQNMKASLSGSISFGMVEGRAPSLAARWIAGFREEYPLVTFTLRNGSSDNVVNDMKRGLVDVALIARPFDRIYLEGIRTARDPWMAIIPKEHPLARREGKTIPLASLVGVPLIVPDRASRVESIFRWFSGIDAEPTIIANTANYLDAEALVQVGAGVSIFPVTTYSPNPGVVLKQIVEPARAIEYDLVWEKDHTHTTLIREFINYVRDSLEESRNNEKTALPAEFIAPDSADLL